MAQLLLILSSVCFKKPGEASDSTRVMSIRGTVGSLFPQHPQT